MHKQRKSAEVLLVEDNSSDVHLIQEVFKDCEVEIHLHVAKDGVDALHFLRRKESYAGSPTPHLILLDLNLPKKDGREVLKEIKQDIFLKHIPVVVLTTSNALQDIIRTYHLQANCYITKPQNLDRFFEVVRTIQTFWLNTTELPSLA